MIYDKFMSEHPAEVREVDLLKLRSADTGDVEWELSLVLDEHQELRLYVQSLLSAVEDLENELLSRLPGVVLSFASWTVKNEVLDKLHEMNVDYEIIDINGVSILSVSKEAAMVLLLTFSELKVIR